MTFAAVGSVIVPSLSAAGSTTVTFSLTPHTSGDFILFEAQDFGSTSVPTAMSSSNVTWTTFGSSFSANNGTFAANVTAQVFKGVVTSTSTATVTITYSGNTNLPLATGQEFSSTVGASSVTLDVQATLNNGTGGTATWPSLTPTHGAGELYYGYAENNGSAVAGSTTGYHYDINADGHSDGAAYNVNCPNSATGPVWGDSQQVVGLMVLAYEAAGAAVSGTVQPRATVPVPRRTAARAVWAGSKPFLGFVSVAAPPRLPPVPRRYPARAVWAGSKPFTGFVAVAAPPQEPRTLPRRYPARAVWAGSKPFTGFVAVAAPPRLPPVPRRYPARAVWAGLAVPPRIGTAPRQLPPIPRRTAARAVIQFTPVTTTNAAPVIPTVAGRLPVLTVNRTEVMSRTTGRVVRR